MRSPDQAADHYNDRDQEHEQRNAVHAVHKPDIYIHRIFVIPFTQIEISKDLFPHDATFLNITIIKLGKHLENKIDLNYICTPLGGLAHLVERLHGMQKVTGSIPVSSTL